MPNVKNKISDSNVWNAKELEIYALKKLAINYIKRFQKLIIRGKNISPVPSTSNHIN